jgi:glucokinase
VPKLAPASSGRCSDASTVVTNVAHRPVLVADIGGTNARFALMDDKSRKPQQVREMSDYPTLRDAMGAYLDSLAGARPQLACLAVAGPIVPGRFHLTNRALWDTEISPVKTALSLEVLDVINDFEALSLAVPLLSRSELIAIGDVADNAPDGPKAVLGPGTGLGLGIVIKTPAGWQALPSEGGHVEIASPDRRTNAVIAYLRRSHDRLSAERLLSGPGLETLHVTLGDVDGSKRQPLNAADIQSGGLKGDPEALDTIRLFLSLLASFAGDVALIAGSRGGIFLAGGVTEKLLPLVDHRSFRAAFENKGRLRPVLEAIPTYVIQAELPALRGCAAHLENRMKGTSLACT